MTKARCIESVHNEIGEGWLQELTGCWAVLRLPGLWALTAKAEILPDFTVLPHWCLVVQPFTFLPIFKACHLSCTQQNTNRSFPLQSCTCAYLTHLCDLEKRWQLFRIRFVAAPNCSHTPRGLTQMWPRASYSNLTQNSNKTHWPSVNYAKDLLDQSFRFPIWALL